MTGLIVVGAVLLMSSGFALWRRRTDGTVRLVTQGHARNQRGGSGDDGEKTSSGAEAGGAALTADQLGDALGRRATLVQFSSAFCAPCRATKVILSDVAARVDGVAHIEIDAESHLDLVREVGILRTPTTLVLDEAGRITARASGVPRPEQVLAALDVSVR